MMIFWQQAVDQPGGAMKLGGWFPAVPRQRSHKACEYSRTQRSVAVLGFPALRSAVDAL